MVVYPFCLVCNIYHKIAIGCGFLCEKEKDYDTKKAYTKERAAGS